MCCELFRPWSLRSGIARGAENGTRSGLLGAFLTHGGRSIVCRGNRISTISYTRGCRLLTLTTIAQQPPIQFVPRAAHVNG